MRKAIKWILIILGGITALLLLLLVVVIIFLGPITEYVIEKKDMEYVGREIEIDDLRFSAFTGKMFIEGFNIQEADSATSFVSFDKLALYGNIKPLFKNRIVIDSFTLDRPYVNIYQDRGSFNFDDLLERFTSPADTIKADTTAKPFLTGWDVDIGPLRIDRGEVDYVNTFLDQDAHLYRVFFHSAGLTSDTGYVDMETGFDFKVNSGIVRVKGNIDYNTLVFDLLFDLDRFSLYWLKRHLQEYMNIHDLQGYLTTDARISGDFMGEIDYRGSGEFYFEDFKLIDPQEDSLFAFNDVYLELDTFNSKGLFYSLSDLIVHEPYLRYALYPEGDNISLLLKPEYFAADSIVNAEEGGVVPGQEYFNVFIYLGQYANYVAKTYAETDYTADSISLIDGTIIFEDYTLKDEALFVMQDMNVTTSKFNSQDEKVTFNMDMMINQSADFDAEWRVNPQDVLEMDLTYTLQGLTISSLSPYSFNYTAHPFISGNLLYEGEVHIHDRELDSKNYIFVEDIDVAKKQYNDPPVKLPVRLAVAIMRNPQGDIELDVPVTGSLDDPNFKYWPIIWQVLKNLMVKAVAAPFKLLAGMFDVDEDALKEVPYAYGKGYLSKDGEKRMKKIAKVLDGKKEFALQYYPKSNADLEKDFIAVDFVKQMYLYDLGKASNGEALDTMAIMQLSPKDSLFNEYILSRTKVTDKLAAASEHCRSIVGAQPLNEAYQKVISARQNSFISELTDVYKIDPSRIQSWTPEPEVVRDTINLLRPTYLLNFDLVEREQIDN